jgi:hypothetical protein
MEHTEYFKLWFDDTDDQAIICRKYDLKGVSRHILSKAKPIEDWPEDITFYAEGEHAEDYLGNARGWLMFSERVRRALEQLGVEGIQFLPVRVVIVETGKELPGYSVMNVLTVLSALDEEHTVYLEPRHEEYPHLSITKVALLREAIGNADIFRLAELKVSVYVSRRVKEHLEEIGATGFKWIPVPSY